MTTDISVGVRWDPLNQDGQQQGEGDYEFDYDGGNSSSRLFERSRIKALAGEQRVKALSIVFVLERGSLFVLYLHSCQRRCLLICSKNWGGGGGDSYAYNRRNNAHTDGRRSVLSRGRADSVCTSRLWGGERERVKRRPPPGLEFIILETDNRVDLLIR